MLYGTAAADSIDGGGGADIIYTDSGDDTLTGGTGNDLLYGEGGSDTYVIGAQAGTDTIDETVGGDAAGIDTVRFVDGIRRSDVTFATAGNNLVASSSAMGFSLSIQNQFVSSSPANQIERFVFADGTVLLAQAVKDEALGGSSLSDSISGFASDDSISAGYGNDFVYGRGGADVLRGGDGADTLYGESGDDSLFGDAGDDLLYGTDGNDRLEGGAGRDRLDGGVGNDTYAFGLGQGNDIVVQDLGGTDTVLLAAGLTAANVSLHRVSAPPAADLAYNGDSLVIQLARRRRPVVDRQLLRQRESRLHRDRAARRRHGMGLRRGDVSPGHTGWHGQHAERHQQGQHVRRRSLERCDQQSVADRRRQDQRIGQLSRAADDAGPHADRHAQPVCGRDGQTSTRCAATTAAIVRSPRRRLGDAVAGGKGDDTYRLRATSESPTTGDDPSSIVSTVITELAAEGIDTLESAYWSAQLPTNVENLLALASNNVYSLSIDSWKENDLAHKFVGNAQANRIETTAYEESSLSQWWYSRRNSGGLSSIGTFRLDGGAGADTLIGGLGNDTYVVDNAGDVVLELGVYKGGYDASIDTVETPFETTLASTYANIENVTLVGTAAVGATGTAVANRLDGSQNSAANRLIGGLGNDTYVVGAGDIVIEGVDEGIDTLVVATATGSTVRLSDYANVENLRLAAASGALDAEGSAAANVLQGSLGNNRLSGGDGDDTLSDQALADIAMYGGRVAVGDRDVLDGGAGDDLLTSYGGDDTFDGGAGDDRIVVYGQTGSYGSTAASAVTVHFGLGDGHDTVQRIATTLNRYAIELEPGSDLSNVHLRTSGDAFVIELADGSSLSFASAVNAGSPPTLAADLNLSLSFADGLTLDRQTLQTLLATPMSATPTAGADLLLGTAGADIIDALDGDDMVLAGAGDDRVNGGAGSDRLSGDAGRDSLFGQAGADTLVGGTGDDLLAGGTGADTYRFARGFGHDLVADDLVAPQVVGADDRSVDSVEFEAGISPTDIAVYHRVEGRDVTGLVLELTATGDSVELHHSHQAFQPGQVESVRFADGTVWDLPR